MRCIVTRIESAAVDGLFHQVSELERIGQQQSLQRPVYYLRLL